MKRCPECRRDYHDDTLSFCLEDGTPLVYGVSHDEPATAILSDPHSSGEGKLVDEPRTAILADTASPGQGITRSGHNTTAARSDRVFDKRLILAPLIIAAIGIACFFAYRYYRPVRQIDSIAVMPFINAGGNSEMDYLSDGMTDTLINSLSRIPNLSVKARSSVFKYKGKNVEPREVAADLNVQAVVNGRVLQRGDDLTLTLELVDTSSGDQIWGEQYVRKVGDLVTLQSDIARDVSDKLRQKLSGGENARNSVRNTANPEAYREYLKGRYHWNRRTKEDLDRSIDYFENAIRIDPTYALAYAGIADSYFLIPSYSNNRAKEAYPKARAAALKALEMDDSLPQAHTTLGGVLHEFDWKFEEAEKEFKRAIELDPNYATAHHWYAELLLTTWRVDEALAEIKRAQECDPLSLIIQSIAGLIHALRGDNAAAEAQLRKTVEMDPNFSRGRVILAGVYERQGRFEEAIGEYEKHAALIGMPADRIEKDWTPVKQAVRAAGAKGYYQAGARLAEEQIKNDPENAPPYFAVGTLFARAGNADRAFEYFEKSLEQREPDILRIMDPELEPLRSDPRYQDILRRMHPRR